VLQHSEHVVLLVYVHSFNPNLLFL